MPPFGTCCTQGICTWSRVMWMNTTDKWTDSNIVSKRNSVPSPSTVCGYFLCRCYCWTDECVQGERVQIWQLNCLKNVDYSKCRSRRRMFAGSTFTLPEVVESTAFLLFVGKRAIWSCFLCRPPIFSLMFCASRTLLVNMLKVPWGQDSADIMSFPPCPAPTDP